MALRDRSKMKKQLQKRTKDSYARKDFGGGGKRPLQLNDTKLWTVKEDDHFIDIIPFEVGSQYPTPPSVAKKDIPEKGDFHYVLDYFVHPNMGPSKRDVYLCIEATYGLPCPICEKMNELLEEGYDWQDKVVADLRPKRRVAYNIWCHDSKKEEKEGVQVLEIAHFFMEKHLAELSRDPKKGGHIAFADPDEGKQIFFNKKGSGMNQEFSGFRFYDRDEPIPDEILEQTVCLDECLTVPTYEELSEVLEVSVKAEKENDKKEPSDKKEKKEEDEVTAENIREMSLKELKKFAKEQELDIKTAKYKKVDELAEKIIEELDLEEETTEEPEEEEEVTADGIREMSLKELKELVKEQELDIKTAKYKKADDLADKIIEELELEEEASEETEEAEESEAEDETEEEGLTADDIREMSLSDLKELVEENDINIKTAKYKKKADAKKLAEKIIEELGLEEDEEPF